MHLQIQKKEIKEEKDHQAGREPRGKVNLRVVLKNRVGLHAGLMALLFVFVSCSGSSNRVVYHQFNQIYNGKWSRDSVLVFSVAPLVAQQGKLYDISIELTTNQRYPYQDLWLRVEQSSTGTIFHDDTLHIVVADENGKWLGGGVGGLYQLSVPYMNKVKSLATDSLAGYQIKIGHQMYDNPLPGVEKVGVRLTELGGANPL